MCLPSNAVCSLSVGPADDHAGNEPGPAADEGAAEEGGGEGKKETALQGTLQERLPLPFPSISLTHIYPTQVTCI